MKTDCWRALDRGVGRAGLPCVALGHGVTVVVDELDTWGPDAVVQRDADVDLDATAAASPVVVVEVLSPSTGRVDTGKKLDHFRLPGIRHYLVRDPVRCSLVHHRRDGDAIATSVAVDGTLRLDPSGLDLDVAACFRFIVARRGRVAARRNTSPNMNARTLIDLLQLRPHPEGGWYAETWRGDERPRPAGSAIHFLLEAHQSSRWHAVDAVEIWHWYAGGALDLHVHHEGETRIQRLGNDFGRGQRPQGIVPTEAWQKAVPVDGWVLVGRTVSPAFEFEGFRLAEPGWSPEGE